jgi:hypothetical protein
MTAFNFFEMILLISLAITFVLILFLVYHFKQRITTTEEKTDTMFDIINNMAQEMTNIRTAMNMVNTPSPPANISHVPSFTKIAVSDEDSDSEYETDSDDEDSGDSHHEDEDSDDGDDENEDEDSGDSDHEDEDSGDISNNEQIKHISMDLDNEIDTQINSDDVNSDNNDIDEKEQPPAELNDTNLVVEKMDEVVEVEVDLEVDVEEEESESLDGRVTYSHSNYRKMNLATLRQMVATRGLSTDTSKMKKNDIISLLENNE